MRAEIESLSNIFMFFSRQQASADLSQPEPVSDPDEAALLRTLFRQILPILAANLTVTAIIVFLLRNHVDWQTLGLWSAAIAVATLGRFALHLQYQRTEPPDVFRD